MRWIRAHVYRTIYAIDEEIKVIYVLTIRHGATDEAAPEELR
jgi:mRNA-degrading endonuclease RelE of RelBE toxin-antitoxin system